jgi:hypothetical protein
MSRRPAKSVSSQKAPVKSAPAPAPAPPLEEGVEGLIHISSISLSPDQKDLEDILHPGQIVQVRILHIDVDRRRLGLGLVNFE